MDTKALGSQRTLCRICLRQFESRRELISLFDHESIFSNKMSFLDMFKTISNHTISENDGLPKKVCILCLQQIRSSYYFYMQIEKSYGVLLQQQKESEISPQKISIKQETIRSLPLIQSPRTIGHELFNDSEDLLCEITDPRMDIDSDNEIIDYEPEFNEFEMMNRDEIEEEEELIASSFSTIVKDANISVPNKSLDSSNDNSITSANENSVSSTNVFPCTICNKKLNSLKALQYHKRGHGSNRRCIICHKNFASMAQVKLHTRFKHPERYNEFRLSFQQVIIRVERLTNFNECTTCHIMFVSKVALLKHHADCDNKCIECGLKIPRKDFYFKHLEMVHKLNLKTETETSTYQQTLECPFCFSIFHSERILEEHVQRLHPDENHSNFETFSEAGESTSTNNEGRLFTCLICQASFQSSKSLNQHRAFKHKNAKEIKVQVKSKNVPKYSKDDFSEKFLVKKTDDFFRCVACQKDIYKRSIMLHIKSKHAAVRSYRCELCSDAFFRSDYRQRHFAAKHANDYKCFDCDVQFDRAFKYDAHMAQQHGILAKNFKPDEGKDLVDLSPHQIKYIENSSNYDYTDDYDEFMRYESRAPSISASVVSEIPLSKDDFIDNYMFSISDLVVNCIVCQQEIKKSSIVSHLLWKHAVKKPLKCAFCDERVVKNNARLSHMARCHPEEYKCSECNQQFVRHYQFVDHMNEFHCKNVTTRPSSYEEDDLSMNEMSFIPNKNEDEIIEDADNINIEINVMPEKKFECHLCSKKFTTPKNLLIHKSHKHKNEPKGTPTSDVSMDASVSSDEQMTFEEFQNNWIEYVNDTDVKCLVCDQKLRKKSLISHIKAKHSTTGAYLCAVCPEKFFRPEHRFQHMTQSHHGIFYCMPCNTQFYRNSRFAKHMNEIHGIDMDSSDNYEVDVNVYDLRFEATIRNNDDDNNSLPSIIHDSEVLDPIIEMMNEIGSTSEEMTRTEFIENFITGIGKERHCLACDKTFLFTSIYHHLIHFHAVSLPFKCPFCNVRFERSYTRNRHLQLFHPKEYNCFECGLQFPKHVKFSDHMAVEHNVSVKSKKSLLEEEDLSSMGVKYVAVKAIEDSTWQEEESPICNSTMISEQHEESKSQCDDSHFLRPKIKKEPLDIPHSIFNTLHVPFPNSENVPLIGAQLPYDDFKQKYLKKLDGETLTCLACDRRIIKTSVCAHLRLWHSVDMMFNCELCNVGFRRSDYRHRHMSLKHPENYKCHECDIQFYYSGMFNEHMFEAHRITMIAPQLKKKDEVDVPLEKMKFCEVVPENLRVHPADESGKKRGRRLSICAEPVDPKAEGITFTQFRAKYIQEKNMSMRCQPCNEPVTKFSIKKHLRRFHATTPSYYCELCDEGFQRLDERLIHVESVHPNAFKCNVCGEKFLASTNYIEHMTNEHNMQANYSPLKDKSEIDVPIERLRFVPQKLHCKELVVKKLEKFVKTKVANSSPQPDVPDDGLLTRDQFTKKFLRNFRDQNNDLQTKCEACNKKIFSAKHKMFHLYHNHAVNRPFGCELCQMRFFSNFKRVKHMKIHHPNEYKCQMCNVQCEKGQIYMEHMSNEHGIAVKIAETKNGDIKHADILYTKKSTAVRVLMRKQKLHTNEESEFDDSANGTVSEALFCEICKIEFSSSRNYRQHIREHGGGIELLQCESQKLTKIEAPKEGTFECEICGNKFLTLVALKTHKRFKHSSGVASDYPKRKAEKQKFEVECQVCSFTAFRRDYVEHHMKQFHEMEFHCYHCNRWLSNYNFFVYHMHNYHKSKEDVSKLHKCPQVDCNAHFKLEDNLQQHIKVKHGDCQTSRVQYSCKICTVNFTSRVSLENHNETHKHKAFEDFLKNPPESYHKDEPCLKDEPMEKKTIQEEISFDDDGSPANKRQKTSVAEATHDDKLDYLKYLQNTPSGFKCGICGKTKALRKYMLHHLKQHEEIPTYECHKCSERFVFKKKYVKHLEMHENGETNHNNDDTMVEDEHPKFQDIKKDSSVIQCSICHLTFKFTIMLNKHNNTWHSADNPMKHLTLTEQKSKKNESSISNSEGHAPITEDNECTAEENEEVAEVEEMEEDESVIPHHCDKCKLVFPNFKFLENHQNFFCLHRNQSKRDMNDVNAINEQ